VPNDLPRLLVFWPCRLSGYDNLGAACLMKSDFENHLLNCFQDLERKLGHAARMAPKSERDASIEALHAVIEFISDIPRLESLALAQPLVRLCSALNDLNNGQQVAFLKPAVFKNRPPDPGQWNVVKASAIFAVECFIAAKPKVALDDACRKVATILEACPIPRKGRLTTPYWKTIRGWRADASRRRDSDQLNDTLKGLRKAFQYPADVHPSEIENDLAMRLRGMVAGFASGLE
jgi:hypothetical protein